MQENDRRRAFIEQTAGVMNGESHGIVIGMPAFVGMCEHEPRLNFKKSRVPDSASGEMDFGVSRFGIGLSALKGVPWKTGGKNAEFQ